jgi:hypothetical protein
MFLIDAHGADHGLSVEVHNHDVTIRQWAECCEPDEHGSYSPHIQVARMSLRKLLDRSQPHFRMGVSFDSMHARIIKAALHWLDYYGGDEERVSDDDTPCQHFGMNYSGIGAKRTKPYPAHMVCTLCGGQPE